MLTTAERWFAVCLQLLGVYLLAYAVAKVSQAVASGKDESAAQDRCLKGLLFCMSERGVGYRLRTKVLNYLTHEFKARRDPRECARAQRKEADLIRDFLPE